MPDESPTYHMPTDEDLRMRTEREMIARLDDIDWEETIREEGEQRNAKKTAQMMRSDGEPEEKVLRYTGYMFKELDTPK